jgi:hypothetical protein
MSTLTPREKLAEEILQIPDEYLSEAYSVIRQFRLNKSAVNNPQNVMRFAGAWKDMPEEELQEFLGEISHRRRQAGRRRRGA